MTTSPSPLPRPLKTYGGALLGVGLFSALVNVLMLTGAFYMLQVYDRVIPSRSVPTLIGLSVLAAVLYAAHGFFDFTRGRVLQRIGRSIDEQVSPRLVPLVARLPLIGDAATGLQPLRDLDQIRSFFASGGLIALFDLPWLPVYLAICFLIHPVIGIAAAAGAAVLAVLTLATELATRRALTTAARHGAVRTNLAEACRSNAEALAAMGMTSRVANLWGAENRKYLSAHERASDVAGALSGLSRVFRIALQSAVMGLGAYLAIHGEASAGIIIASSIIAARALAPVETAIAHWKSFVGARQSWQRLGALLARMPERDPGVQPRQPRKALSVEAMGIVPPGAARPVVRNMSFGLAAGSALGVIGPSASGKSSLARALVGVWTPTVGNIRLDGASLDQWTPDALGRHIGYLPQDIKLFDGTVADNIARFDPDAGSDSIMAAAEAAGVHDMILRLPNGYETRIGEGGTSLSAGQRQRIALARALYGDPFLVVLDEPNSNLDADGEMALQEAIGSVRQRGGIAVVIAHRPSAVAAVDLLLVMNDGQMQAFGPKDEVLRKVVRPVAQAPTPMLAGAV